MNTTLAKESASMDPKESRPGQPPDPERQRETLLVEQIAPPAAQDAPARRGMLARMALLGGGAGLLILLLLQHLTFRPERASKEDLHKALIGRIDRMMDLEDWQGAISAATLGLAEHPQSGELRTRQERAELEQRNKWCYESFLAAARRGDTEAALLLFSELPERSFYRTMARPEAERLREGFVESRLARARGAVQLGLCDEVRRLALAIEDVDPGVKEARDLAGSCQPLPRRPLAPKKSEAAEFEIRRLPRADATGLRNPF